MSRRKPDPDLIRGGRRFADQDASLWTCATRGNPGLSPIRLDRGKLQEADHDTRAGTVTFARECSAGASR